MLEFPEAVDFREFGFGVVWKDSRLAIVSENSGVPIPKDSKVDVYESLIIVRHIYGSRQVVPLEFVRDLKIK